MINQERVIHMTKLAMFEEQNERKYQPMLHYNKRDYLTLHTMLGFIIGTLFYLVVYAVLCIGYFAVLTQEVHMFNILVALFMGIVLYIIYLYYYLRHIRKKAAAKYNAGREMLASLVKQYDQLEALYEQEEQTKIPEGWE